MTTLTLGISQIASRYAASLLDLAAAANAVENVEKDLTELAGMIESSDDLRCVIKSPLLQRGQKQRALLAVSDKAGFHDLTRRFLGVLAQNRRTDILPSAIVAFHAALDARRGSASAQVQTAFALTPAQTEALQAALSARMGRKVALNVTVDKSLLGGMVVTVGSVMIDSSVKRQLERLGRSMASKSAA